MLLDTICIQLFLISKSPALELASIFILAWPVAFSFSALQLLCHSFFLFVLIFRLVFFLEQVQEMFMISQQQPAAQSPITVEPFSFSFFMFVTVSVGNNKTAMGGKISICRPRHLAV